MARKRHQRPDVSPELSRLFELMELPETHLSKTELAELDAYVAAQTAAIRAGWTIEQEAMARGVKFRPSKDKQYLFDGRIFQSVQLKPVESRDAEDLLYAIEMYGLRH